VGSYGYRCKGSGATVGDDHKGPLIVGANTPFSKIIKSEQTNPQTATRVVMAQGREGPTTQKALAAQQAAGPRHPSANLCLARGSSMAPRNLRLARGLDAPSGEPPPRSRTWRPFGRVSTSLKGPGPMSEFPSRSRPLSTHGVAPTPPTGALNSLAPRGHPGQR
jgi:hypothetical protein